MDGQRQVYRETETKSPDTKYLLFIVNWWPSLLLIASKSEKKNKKNK